LLQHFTFPCGGISLTSGEVGVIDVPFLTGVSPQAYSSTMQTAHGLQITPSCCPDERSRVDGAFLVNDVPDAQHLTL
jgi:hypothetical protein